MLADLQKLHDETAELAAASLWPLADSAITDCLRAAFRLEQAAAVLQTLLVREATGRGIPAEQGHRSTGSWLRAQLLLDPRPARELTERADLFSRQPSMAQAVLDGRLDARQATVIATTLETIPAELAELDRSDSAHVGPDGTDPDRAHPDRADPDGADPDGTGATLDGSDGALLDPAGVGAGEDRAGSGESARIVRQAETTLIGMAGRLPAFQLRRVGERILAHVAPHLSEQADEAALRREEARAYRRRGITLSAPAGGIVYLRGALGVEDAAILQAALHPLCTPRSGGRHGIEQHGPGQHSSEQRGPEQRGPEQGGPGQHSLGQHSPEQRSPEQQRADALIDICRLALRTGELPADGGRPPQLTITVALDPLTRRLGRASTDTGERLSAGAARRLACDSHVLPVVLGGAGQVLDAGRARRLATGPLRQALAARDGGCAFADCDRPPRWTDAHHIRSWADGGTTDLDNLVLLCRPHHRQIHDPANGWQIRMGPDQLPDFIPPPAIDPGQAPRRNLYHPRR